MKTLPIVAAVAMLLVQITARQAEASEGFEDLVKVVKSGADEKALAAYIDASPVAYSLTVDEVLFLNDLGLSAEMIKTVSEHGKRRNGDAVEPAPPAPAEAAPQPAAEEPPPPVSLPQEADAVQETVADAPVVTAPPSETADVSSFYGALSPYGSWVNVDGAWHWQPTAMVVDSGWSPYCHRGHWVYTDCGWMWQSDYSWGWAPFHYGRWSRHYRYGWIWLPDTVWGPAWVSWRHCDAAIGWAPLPPAARYEAGIGFSFHGNRVSADFEFGLASLHFTFVPVAHMSERRLVQSRLPRNEVTRIYNTTTVIQNNYTYNDNRIINRGPSITHIQAVTHQEIRQVKIVDQNIRPGQPIRRPAISGESMAVYRPHVAPTAHETPKAAVARRQADVQIKHEEARKAPILMTYKSGPVVQAEEARGKASLETAHAGATPHVPSRSPAPPAANQGRAEEQARHLEEQRKPVQAQRQAEEAAARRREDQQRRTDAFAHQQEEKRNAEALSHQREEQRRRGQELARKQEEQRRQPAQLAHQPEQKRNDEEIARQREEQRRRAQELARQQEQQRRSEELRRQQQEQQQRAEQQARQREEQQKRAQEQARQQEERRKAVQAQRQAEEAAARQREQHQQQTPQQRPQQSVLQGYGNSSTATAASTRGFASRSANANPRNH